MNGIEYLWLRNADGIKPEDRRRFYHVPETKTFWEWALTCNRPVTGKAAGGGALTFDEDPGVERIPADALKVLICASDIAADTGFFGAEDALSQFGAVITRAKGSDALTVDEVNDALTLLNTGYANHQEKGIRYPVLNLNVPKEAAGGINACYREEMEHVPRGAVLRFPRAMVTSTAATVPGLVLTALLYRHLDMQQSGDFGHANVYALTNIMKGLEGFDGVSEREAAYRILPVLDSLTRSGVLEFWALMAQNPGTKKWNKVPKNIKMEGCMLARFCICYKMALTISAYKPYSGEPTA